MNTQQKKIILYMLCLFIIMLLPTLVLAQIDTEPGAPEAEVPIDGGLSLLVAAGVGYGAKKMKERKANKQLSKN